jgi:transcriptional regulator with XRE-family HTH domain
MAKTKKYNSDFRNIRIKKGMDIYDVSKATGLSRFLVSRIECGKGNPGIKHILVYCNAIGVKLISVKK